MVRPLPHVGVLLVVLAAGQLGVGDHRATTDEITEAGLDPAAVDKAFALARRLYADGYRSLQPLRPSPQTATVVAPSFKLMIVGRGPVAEASNLLRFLASVGLAPSRRRSSLSLAKRRTDKVCDRKHSWRTSLGYGAVQLPQVRRDHRTERTSHVFDDEPFCSHNVTRNPMNTDSGVRTFDFEETR
jgi:hypothetical protein